MAVLSDTDILERIGSGSLKIEGFAEKNLTPNGYDVVIEEVWIPSTDARFKDGTATIPAAKWFVVGTKEFIAMPLDLVAEIWIRTTWVRKGVLSSFGRIDAGFHGNLTFSAFNASTVNVEIPVGDRFAQVVFEELRSPPQKSYSERSGNYHGQRGITVKPTKDQRN